jgi:hypothetical protein
MLGFHSPPLPSNMKIIFGHQRTRTLAGSKERRTEQHFTVLIVTSGDQRTNVVKLIGTFFVASRCECAQNI